MYFPAATNRWLHALALLTCCAVTLGVLSRLVQRLTSGYPVHVYNLTLYWWNYDYGLTRRALPGALLSLTGGATPDRAIALAVLLSVVAGVACVCLAVAITRTWDRQDRWIPLVLVAAGPFTLSLIALDVGRYDTVGFSALAGVALLARRRSRPWPRTFLASVLVVVAVASEEFMLGFLLLPVAVLVRRAHATRRGRLLGAVVALGPGSVLSGLLLVRQPRAAHTREAYTAATEWIDTGTSGNALSNLSLTFDEQMRFFTAYPPGFIVLTSLAWMLGYALFAHVLLRRIDSTSRVVPVLLSTWPATVAVALGLVGVDYRRWWALALVSLVACIVALHDRSRQPAVRCERPRLDVAVLVVALLFCIGAQDGPIDPSTSGPLGRLLGLG